MPFCLFRALTIIVGAMFCAALYSCKGDSPAVPVEPSKISLLTAHPWFLVGLTSTAANGGTVNDFAAIPNCLKDNTLLFKPSQSFTYDPGIISCNAEGPRDVAWSFEANETQLKLAELPGLNNGQVQFEIVALTTTTLQLVRFGAVYTYSDKGNFTPPSAERQVVFNRLTSHKWRMSKSTVYGNTIGGGSTWVLTDLYATTPACRRDDFLQFNVDYTLVNDEGNSRCASTDPQSKSTRWGLGDNGQLSIQGMVDVVGVPLIIPGYPGGIQVTDTTLAFYSSYYRQGNGYNTTVIYTPF